MEDLRQPIGPAELLALAGNPYRQLAEVLLKDRELQAAQAQIQEAVRLQSCLANPGAAGC